MENKNIVFNCTLEQYNKKYRNRRYRLLKYTKKQVEDFDKQYGHYIFNNKTYTLEFNKYLLKDRKWALIGDTYYEIPKPIRYTWFRNLNAACQIGTCVLAAGVVASAITVPLVLLNETEGPTITIQGAEYDKSKSYIKLNEDSCIVLIEKQGNPIRGIKSVKVGGVEIAKDDDYKFDQNNKKVNIFAHAMKSTDIEINISSKVSKASFIEAYENLRVVFENHFNMRYTSSQIKISEFMDMPKSPSESIQNIDYDVMERTAKFQYSNLWFDFGPNYYSNEALNQYLVDESNPLATYKIEDDYIEYEYSLTTKNAENIYNIKLNKHGYLVRAKSAMGGYRSFTLDITGDPS